MRSSGRLAVAAVGLALLGLSGSSLAADIAQKGTLRVTFAGDIAPRRLPRSGVAPVTVTIGGRVSTTDGSEPPQLQRIALGINRNGHLDLKDLPKCRLPEIQPSTTRNAALACGRSEVGHGKFFASVGVPGQAPFPSEGKLVAFNGVYHGKPAIFAHVYGTNPVPTSFTLPLVVGRGHGTFGTTLTAELPTVTGKAGFITGIELVLGKRWRSKGSVHSYVSAGCPAPEGFPAAVFPLARASFGFAGGKTLSSTLVRNCKAR